MFAIIGIVIVLGAIAAGYTMEHGNFKVLMQPAELVIIFGAAVGTVVIANPLPTLIKIGKGLAGVFSGSPFTKAFYLESLKMLYELFALSRKAGTAKLEEEVDNPSKGQVFNKYPKFVKNHHALHFLCDTLRMAVSGGVDPMEIDTMMEIDLDVHHTRSRQADRRVEHDGGCAAGTGYRGRRARSGVDHGRAGRPQGGDRREGGGGAGGHVSGNSAVLRHFRAAGCRRWERTAMRSPTIWDFCAWRRWDSSRT